MMCFHSACWLNSMTFVASATCWGSVAQNFYIYGTGRERPWELNWPVRATLARDLGKKALILHQNLSMERRSAGRRWGTIRRGKNRWCVNLQGERYRLRERMLEQRGGALDIRYWRQGRDERGRSRTS